MIVAATILGAPTMYQALVRSFNPHNISEKQS